MKASLQLNLSQQLTLTPQLQQAIRLLQLSTQDLNQEIQQALESNPMLEVSNKDHDITVVKSNDAIAAEKTAALESYFHQSYASSASFKGRSNDYNYEHFLGTEVNLQDHLMWQLELTPMSETDQMIAFTIIEAVNDEGFLTQSPTALFESLQQEIAELEFDEFEAVRHRIMRFEPLGVCSKDLSECLITQLSALSQDTPYKKVAIKILSHDIQLLAQHNYRSLYRKYKLKEQDLKNVILLIQTLDPKPGYQITPPKSQYVTPDVIVTKENNHWLVKLNGETLPKLAINGHYAGMIQRADSSSDNTFLKNNLQEARWFLKSIESRQETLLKVACCIVDLQKDFLENGEECMKPLILNDIAEKLEMHESTISRVTTQKYIHTPRGVFELKYFFSSHLSTKTGGECSSTAIRAVIKKLINNENQKKPLSDSKIALILKDKGVNVARRTIAKYREAMGIPPSNERKSLIR